MYLKSTVMVKIFLKIVFLENVKLAFTSFYLGRAEVVDAHWPCWLAWGFEWAAPWFARWLEQSAPAAATRFAWDLKAQQKLYCRYRERQRAHWSRHAHFMTYSFSSPFAVSTWNKFVSKSFTCGATCSLVILKTANQCKFNVNETTKRSLTRPCPSLIWRWRSCLRCWRRNCSRRDCSTWEVWWGAAPFALASQPAAAEKRTENLA